MSQTFWINDTKYRVIKKPNTQYTYTFCAIELGVKTEGRKWEKKKKKKRMKLKTKNKIAKNKKKNKKRGTQKYNVVETRIEKRRKRKYFEIQSSISRLFYFILKKNIYIYISFL